MVFLCSLCIKNFRQTSLLMVYMNKIFFFWTYFLVLFRRTSSCCPLSILCCCCFLFIICYFKNCDANRKYFHHLILCFIAWRIFDHWGTKAVQQNSGLPWRRGLQTSTWERNNAWCLLVGLHWCGSGTLSLSF